MRTTAIAACALAACACAHASPRMLFDSGTASYAAVSSGGQLRQDVWGASEGHFHGVLFEQDGLRIALRADHRHLWLEHSRDTSDTAWLGSSAQFEMFVTFTEPATLLVQWDLAAWDQGDARLTSPDLSQQMTFPQGPGDAGSTLIPVAAGRILRFVGATSGLAGGGDAFIRFTIVPAPPASAALAIALCAATRRRR